MFTAILALFIGTAHAQTVQDYAVICSSACQSYDAGGNPVQQPPGYVQNIIRWDGLIPYAPGPGLELRLAGTLAIGDITTP